MANIALANFDALAQTSRQRSQRSAFVVEKARQSWANSSDAPPDIEPVAVDGTWQWQRLRHITIGPFRGFRTPEPFDLQKRVVLFYGPNGSGKTSFCEGLEYSLLGSVEEADTKRIEARTYLANVHARKFQVPTLTATNQNREVPVEANADTYRFCFVEKNRIDAFSRIAARPPAQRTELIATLFGMEKFNEFVSHFNESIDQQLVLVATKQLALTNKRATLTADHETVNGLVEAEANLSAEEAALAFTYRDELTYVGLKELIGTIEVPGRLHELEIILNAIPPAVIGLSRQDLLSAFEAAQIIDDALTDAIRRLEARSRQVSFKDLYTAVLALHATEGDHCPACDTPLAGDNRVVTNPYEKAATGLVELRELDALQETRDALQTEVSTAANDIRQKLRSVSLFISAQGEQENLASQYLANLPAVPQARWWAEIYRTDPATNAPVLTPILAQILAYADLMATQDAASQLATQQRQPHIAERDRLNECRLLVQAQDMKRQQVVDKAKAARDRIAAFDAENEQLLADVEQEALDIARDTPIRHSYDRLLELLKSYRNTLPGTLMAGLNETAMSLYNQFNRNDLDRDKLEALHLPLTGDDKIEISFRGSPGVRVDALRILSEGHIRCLGLAILLAKNISIQSPLIVFDDVINAIDHDHRAGIRETIFESDLFELTQLIVTCHSNEFIKDIQQHLPANRRNECQVYLFQSADENYQPRVRGNVTSRNYIEKARASKDALDDREALASSRRALEMLSEKTWAWLGSHGFGALNLELAGAGAPPGLRNLGEAILKRLREATTFAHANKQHLIGAYGRILGIPATNLVWTYLNKGTHEEANRDDFDAELVESVVRTLEEIDRLDLRANR